MPTKTKTPTPDLMGRALAAEGGFFAVAYVFKCMDAAEVEIGRSKLTKDQSSRAFGALCPSPAMRGKSLDLYRAHAREMIARVKAGGDLRPATDAELLAVFSDTSLIAPMGQNGAAAFEALFARVFPEKRLPGQPAGREQWPMAVVEVIETTRRKYTVSGRGQE